MTLLLAQITENIEFMFAGSMDTLFTNLNVFITGLLLAATATGKLNLSRQVK